MVLMSKCFACSNLALTISMVVCVVQVSNPHLSLMQSPNGERRRIGAAGDVTVPKAEGGLVPGAGFVVVRIKVIDPPWGYPAAHGPGSLLLAKGMIANRYCR